MRRDGAVSSNRDSWAVLTMLSASLSGCDPETTSKPADDDTPVEDTETTVPPGACYADADGDGYGEAPVDPCTDDAVADGDAVANDGDCDDDEEDVHPGAPETCDAIDNDCDGRADDADDDLVDGLPFYADRDGDGFGADTLVTGCVAAEGLVFVGGDCDDGDETIHPSAAEICDDIDQDCNGLSGDALGASAECPATTCLEVLQAGGTTDGARWLVLPSGTATPAWCDMTTDGGGWTLGFLRNTASAGSQGEFGSGELGLEAIAGSGETASASSTPLLGWMDLNSFSWSELRLAAWYNGAATYTSRNIPRTALLNQFGDPGYLLYGGETGYYWCGGPASYTDAAVGATNNPSGAPPDCKGHGSLGSGWDFSESPYVNAGLTLCGGDGSYFLTGTWGGTYAYYGTPGGAQGIWVR